MVGHTQGCGRMGTLPPIFKAQESMALPHEKLDNRERNAYPKKSHLFQRTLVPLANFLLLVSLHFLVVEMLRSALDVVEAELGVLLCFAGVVRQVANSPCPVWLTVLQPGEQLRRPLFPEKSRGRAGGLGICLDTPFFGFFFTIGFTWCPVTANARDRLGSRFVTLTPTHRIKPTRFSAQAFVKSYGLSQLVPNPSMRFYLEVFNGVLHLRQSARFPFLLFL